MDAGRHSWPRAGRAKTDNASQPSHATSADHAADDSDPEPRCWLQDAAESPAWSSASGNGSESDSDTRATEARLAQRGERLPSWASTAAGAATAGEVGKTTHRRDTSAAVAAGRDSDGGDAGMAIWRRMEESWLREWAAGRGGLRHGAPAGASDAAGGRESDLGNAGEGLDLGGDVDAELRGRWGRGMSPIVQEWAQWPA